MAKEIINVKNPEKFFGAFCGMADKSGILEMWVDELGCEPYQLGMGRYGDNNVLWKGDTEHWDKHDPILFPTIGKSADGRVIVDGKEYAMPKHGFAQKCVWKASRNYKRESLIMELESCEATMQYFPFPFTVRQIYTLPTPYTMKVRWEVESSTEMPFMMGAHPAFALPDFHAEDEVHGYLQFDVPELVSNSVLPDGLLHAEQTTIKLEEGNLLPLTNHTFDCDTILDLRGLNKEVTLLDKDKKPVVTLRHSMPVLALWAPKNGCAPFVCIEPWYGCCDTPDYGGEFKDKPFAQHVKPNEIWSTEYEIIINC